MKGLGQSLFVEATGFQLKIVELFNSFSCFLLCWLSRLFLDWYLVNFLFVNIAAKCYFSFVLPHFIFDS